MKKIIITLGIATSILSSCDDRLDVPLTELSDEQIASNPSEFLESFTVAAYAELDSSADIRRWESSPSDWVYGSISSDDAYKGSEEGDQGDMNQIERYGVVSTNPFLNNKWRQLYDGIFRANLGIRTAQSAINQGSVSESEGNRVIGELRFLRGHYHFEAKTMFNNIPFIDENQQASADNKIDAWPRIEDDFIFAAENMTEKSVATGRVNSWAAKAYLAKTHMYQLDYPAAKLVLDDVINNGPYQLNTSFHDNFNAATNNSIESIFAVQYAINDGSGSGQDNGNYGDILNFPHGDITPFGCCGFHQPSHDLVNAYLVDSTTGLPFVNNPITDPADYVANDDANDLVDGVDSDGNTIKVPRNPTPNTGEADNFIEETRPLDPRLDWTVGRKGLPFLGWGDYGGITWVRDPGNGGPYAAKKHIWENSQDDSGGTPGAWGQQVSAVNTNIIRFAELILWRAEIAAANDGDLGEAARLVDLIRERASDPSTWVKNSDGSDAANYQIGLYSDNGGFPSQEFALDAILYEHRLEMALEGHRFFELVRLGRASEILNSYLSRNQFREYLEGLSFGNANRYYPIPQTIIDLSQGVITQN